MDNLVILLSHCNTPDKINILKKLIKRLKDLNIDMLLCSHIPVETSIQEAVTYYIYDKNNPVLHWPERGYTVWFKHPSIHTSTGAKTLPVMLQSMFPDYGWTALDQMKKAANFGLPLKYNYYSFLNYDTIFTPELDSYLLNPAAQPHSIIGSNFSSTSSGETDGTGLLFTVIKRDTLEKINVRINKADYLNHRFAEKYWHTLLSPHGVFALPFQVKDCMTVHKGGANQNYFNDDFEVFFQNGDTPTYSLPDPPPLTKAFFYNIKDNTSIKILCNDQSYLIKKASIIDLPTNVTKLGFWNKDTYCDFLPEFDKAKSRCHSIALQL